jgi:drug/metabolite transporter (DMT)-like permease
MRMTREMIPSMLLAVFSVFVASVSQTLLKWESGREHKSLVREYLNPGVIGGYGLLALSMLLTMFAYKKLPLSLTPAFESFSYIFVTIFGVTIFHEKLDRWKLIALTPIIGGIIVYSALG